MEWEKKRKSAKLVGVVMHGGDSQGKRIESAQLLSLSLSFFLYSSRPPSLPFPERMDARSLSLCSLCTQAQETKEKIKKEKLKRAERERGFGIVQPQQKMKEKERSKSKRWSKTPPPRLVISSSASCLLYWNSLFFVAFSPFHQFVFFHFINLCKTLVFAHSLSCSSLCYSCIYRWFRSVYLPYNKTKRFFGYVIFCS